MSVALTHKTVRAYKYERVFLVTKQLGNTLFDVAKTVRLSQICQFIIKLQLARLDRNKTVSLVSRENRGFEKIPLRKIILHYNRSEKSNHQY